MDAYSAMIPPELPCSGSRKGTLHRKGKTQISRPKRYSTVAASAEEPLPAFS